MYMKLLVSAAPLARNHTSRGAQLLITGLITGYQSHDLNEGPD